MPTKSLRHIFSSSRRALVFLGFAAAALTASQANGQNLIVNGDFELGPYQSRSAVGGWSVSGTGFIMVNFNEGVTTGSWAATLDEGGNSQNNTLSQTIATTPGQTYIFEYDGGIYGIPSTALQVRWQAIGNTIRFDETIAPPIFGSFNGSDTEFHHYFRMFTADSTSTIIRFTDIGTGNASSDLVIDAVSVIPMPAPTPSPTPTYLPLLNADFETWPFNYPGVVANWTVGGNQHIETITQGATSPNSKGHSVGLSVGSDSFNNILSQTFITTPGQSYNLDFDAGVYGTHSGSALQVRAQIIGSSPAFSATVTPPEAHTIHPTQVTFTHYHFTFIAGGTLATIQFTDLVGGNGGADTMIDTVSILPVGPTTFMQWQSTYFTLAQRNDANYSSWTADPDFDGIRNGLEYYFHMDPNTGITAADQPDLPQVGFMSIGGSTYLTFSYHRLLGWTGNTPVVAVSDDLVNWDTSQSQIVQVGSPARADGYTDIVTVRLKNSLEQGVTKKHFRLMLTQ
jgi:hypothetical protein